MQINDIKGVVHVLLFQYLNPRFEWKVNPLAETADYVLHFLIKFYPPKTPQKQHNLNRKGDFIL